MKQLSATDAARRFSDVLNSVESRRETFVVLRRGRAVAKIGPALAGTGEMLKDALREHRPDAEWAGELRQLRESVGPPTDPWRD
jgi:antitoxin (DNA-binding transcriptional repressor) of toxin-antitoxin stability system